MGQGKRVTRGLNARRRKTGERRIGRLRASGEASRPAKRSYRPWREGKKRITMFLDADVLAWFQEEPKYQMRINEALRKVVRREKGGAGKANNW